MTDRHTDGNGEAGLLAEVFAAEATVLVRRCGGCGAAHRLAEHRAYHGAGVVLRCPRCGDAGLRIVTAGDRRLVQLHGTLEVRQLP
jgi:NAD-dependent SIR2 family protein deacetylase